MSRLITACCLAVLFLVSCSSGETLETEDNYDYVELADGSAIYLNKHTKISYPDNFTTDRTVELEGEAYFEVEEGDIPFIIRTSWGDVKITGTKLDVEARSEDESLNVEVDEGAVEVSTKKVKKVIKKGERAVTKTAHDIETGKAERKFRNWLKELELDLEKLGRKTKRGLKKGEKSVERGAKKVEKKLKKLVN